MVLHGQGRAEEREEVQDAEHLCGCYVHSGGPDGVRTGHSVVSAVGQGSQDEEGGQEHHQSRHGWGSRWVMSGVGGGGGGIGGAVIYKKIIGDGQLVDYPVTIIICSLNFLLNCFDFRNYNRNLTHFD